MNVKRVVFETGKVGFGLTHLVLQTMADACVLAELELVKRTGYYNPESKQMIELQPEHEGIYKEALNQRTDVIQGAVKTMTKESWQKGLNYFKSKSLGHESI